MEKYKKIILPIFLADALLIFSHFLWGKESAFFNLDAEGNLPAIYSGLKLLVIGCLAFLIYRASIAEKSWMWLVFGGLFAYLGLDEIFELHEKLADYFARYGLTSLDWYTNHVFYWTLIFLPLIIFAIGFLIYFIRYFWTHIGRPARNFFVFGLFFFTVVIALEIAGGLLSDTSAGYWLMSAEEASEIFGATLFLAGVLAYRLNRRDII